MSGHNVERRHFRRMKVRIDAYLLAGENTYVGFIKNISEDGFEYVVDDSIIDETGLRDGEVVEVYFQLPSGEALKLHCKLKWFSMTFHGKGSFIAGMKIINPSPKLQDFLKVLGIVNVN